MRALLPSRRSPGLTRRGPSPPTATRPLALVRTRRTSVRIGPCTRSREAPVETVALAVDKTSFLRVTVRAEDQGQQPVGGGLSRRVPGLPVTTSQSWMTGRRRPRPAPCRPATGPRREWPLGRPRMGLWLPLLRSHHPPRPPGGKVGGHPTAGTCLDTPVAVINWGRQGKYSCHRGPRAPGAE